MLLFKKVGAEVHRLDKSKISKSRNSGRNQYEDIHFWCTLSIPV